jgi:hypothetical protein
MNVVLWILQALLAALFLFAGGSKFVMTPAQMQLPVWLSIGFMHFIGVCEVLGAFGLILPGIFRIRKGLTPLAACGLIVIMAGAVVVTILLGQGPVAAIPLVIGLLLACVAYGRRDFLFKKV